MLILSLPGFSVSSAVTGEQLQHPLGEARGKQGEWPRIQGVRHKLGERDTEATPPSEVLFQRDFGPPGTSPVQSRGCWKGESELKGLRFPAGERGHPELELMLQKGLLRTARSSKYPRILQ